MAAEPLYESIGRGYARHRRADPRIAAQVHAALGDAGRVLDVGAGTGSYEPADRAVVAIEPSPTMIAQRRQGAAPVVCGLAGALPFNDDAFDAAMAVLTVHHWPDPIAGLRELRRVTRGPVVVLTFDTTAQRSTWLVAEYLPAFVEIDVDNPTGEAIAAALGGGHVEVVPVPHDCVDGFGLAYWRRPEAYLDPAARACISGIARLHPEVVDAAVARLAADLADGSWHTRHADLLGLDVLDGGYRLVVSPD